MANDSDTDDLDAIEISFIVKIGLSLIWIIGLVLVVLNTFKPFIDSTFHFSDGIVNLDYSSIILIGILIITPFIGYVTEVTWGDKRLVLRRRKVKRITDKADKTFLEAKPETAKPETAKPETAKPETAKPETAKPETAKPETAKPETAKPIGPYICMHYGDKEPDIYYPNGPIFIQNPKRIRLYQLQKKIKEILADIVKTYGIKIDAKNFELPIQYLVQEIVKGGEISQEVGNSILEVYNTIDEVLNGRHIGNYEYERLESSSRLMLDLLTNIYIKRINRN